jgi:N-acylneuraminate cytidylyltransferase
MKYLVLIPARGGSKRVPKKNIKLLNGKSLICYTVDAAREIFLDDDICVSTDSENIKKVVEQTGLFVPFLRPEYLATDTAGSYEMILHAVEYYEQKGKQYDAIVLLQPTSPFRQAMQIKEAIANYSNEIDMVVSVKEAKANPYYTLFEETNGFLKKSKKGNFIRAQDCPKVYEYNGAIYVINIESLKKSKLGDFKKVKKFVMDEESSLDIDTPLDFLIAQTILTNR